jgi:hypothetical protein
MCVGVKTRLKSDVSTSTHHPEWCVTRSDSTIIDTTENEDWLNLILVLLHIFQVLILSSRVIFNLFDICILLSSNANNAFYLFNPTKNFY